MEEGEEDPYGYLIKFCRPTSSQELKLQNCPFARESETFPDAFDSLGSSFSPTPTPSQQPGIVMVSPPESEDDEEDLSNDENNPRAKEEFHTPPEHHRLSSSSSQEDPTPRISKPISAVDEKIDGLDDVERIAVDEGCRDGEAGRKDLGHSESEEIFGFVNRVMGANCFGSGDKVENKMKKVKVFEGESDEPAVKKIRASGENWDSNTHTLRIGEAQVTEKVADDDELINLDSEETETGEEIGLNKDKNLTEVDSAGEESEDDHEASGNGEKSKKDGVISDSNSNRGREVEKVQYGGSHGHVSNAREEGVHLNDGEEIALNSVTRNNGKEVLGFRVGGFDGGEKSLWRDGDLVVEESEEELRDSRKNGKEVLGCMSGEDVDKFKYDGGGDGGEPCWKEVVRRKRELPLSMRGKGTYREGKVGHLDVKNLSFKELLDAAAVFLEKGSGDVDFLEAAKRKGMTFPRPR